MEDDIPQSTVVHILTLTLFLLLFYYYYYYYYYIIIIIIIITINRFAGDCKFGRDCRYKHACSACGDPHPISKYKASSKSQAEATQPDGPKRTKTIKTVKR